jgi:Flp pilus assembly protein TadG
MHFKHHFFSPSHHIFKEGTTEGVAMKSIITKFIDHCGGNFAIIAALAGVPLVFATGAALDGSRLYSAKIRMQGAIDAAALSVVKESGFDKTAAQNIAERMLQANFGPDYRGLNVELLESGATITAELVIPTTLTSALGYKEMTASVSGTVEYPQTTYEIGLVLDTTGSMEGTKLAEMKKAAAEMIDELSSTAELRRRVKIALVPFSGFVNVGGDKATAKWLDQKGDVYLPNSNIPEGVERLKIFANFGMRWAGCVETRIEDGTEAYATDDTSPDLSKPRTLFVPMLAPDEPGTKSGGRHLFPNNFVNDDTLAGLGVNMDGNSIVYEPVTPDKKAASYPFYSNGTDPQGPNFGCDSQPVAPLTDDVAKLKSQIAKLEAAGSTNITEGVAWGQRVLSPGEPFAEGAPASDDVKKIMVLLTDGDNSITALSNANGSAYSSYGYLADGRWNKSYKKKPAKKKCEKVLDPLTGKKVKGCVHDAVSSATAGSSTAVANAMNADTAAACEATKASGTEIYTIRLEVSTTSSSGLLSSCASDKNHYYDARSAVDLRGIFADIAKRIMKMRITS